MKLSKADLAAFKSDYVQAEHTIFSIKAVEAMLKTVEWTLSAEVKCCPACLKPYESHDKFDHLATCTGVAHPMVVKFT